jgi:glycosyltransferase involved in cell wall biosynthesis
MTAITGYVPCFDNAETILQAVESIRRQTVSLQEVYVVNDGSSDGSGERLERAGVRVIHLPRNLGRGAARARAMSEAQGEFVLCCDATNILPPDFSARALRHFTDPRVAAVFGRIGQLAPRNAIERWRGRHLFKVHAQSPVNEAASLATYGALVRREAVEAVGGYDASLRHSEDANLGARLLSAGYKVILDPGLEVTAVTGNTLSQVLERYWRWHAGADEKASWRGYSKQVVYSIKVMARQDLAARDLAAAAISLWSPHDQFWRSRLRRFWRLQG